jgi:DNA-binding XRE family transcriptional regulator|tara:strand:+ start:1824 stop:2024 length:201 start_codon:yes stop_codon:yes gene_type:complete
LRLRKIRIYQGLTQDELRQLSGVALKTITNIEREKHLPKLETMLKIAKALSVDLTDIDEFKQRIAA